MAARTPARFYKMLHELPAYTLPLPAGSQIYGRLPCVAIGGTLFPRMGITIACNAIGIFIYKVGILLRYGGDALLHSFDTQRLGLERDFAMGNIVVIYCCIGAGIGQRETKYHRVPLWRNTSYIITPAATETLREPILPNIGMATISSHCRNTAADTPVSSAPIQIDGVFTDWIPVYPEFRDDIGDPVHRNHSGWGKSGIYKNHTGRNDIISAKISISKNNLYTYVRTFEPMHAIKQDHWMLLFLDTDENSTNGWMGYDFMIRSHPENIDQALVQKHTGSIGQYCWENITSVKRCINGTQMEIEIPLEILKLDSETLQYVDFKWADNIQETGEARDLTINGDVAPNDRYNYRAIFRKKRTEK